MTLEREVLLSALRMTKDGSAKIEDISRDAKVPAEIVSSVVRKNSEREILELEEEAVVMNREQRLRAAVRVIGLGADPERVCNLLEWNEFEDVSAIAFESIDFSVKKHFRFKHRERRWEIDILALKNPVVACVDCKHWHKGWRRSSIRKIVESQIKRTQALSEASAVLHEKIGITRWKEAKFIPIVLSLFPGDFKFHEDVPIVPILQLRNFLHEMPAHIDSLTHFSKSLLRLGPERRNCSS